MRIAVVGGGVSGLSAFWALNEHSDHVVDLFEAAEYVGGHTHTVDFKREGFKDTPVDTGFIVFNEVTYPNFLRFLRYVGVKIIASDMSFSVTRTSAHPTPHRTPAWFTNSAASPFSQVRGAFEWAGGSPLALFSQLTNLLNPGHWRMVWEVIRFNHQALETLRKGGEADTTIGQWLDQRGYGEGFRRNYLIPMTSSIWSTPPSTAFSAFPASTLLTFMHNHHLLQILSRPQWLTIRGGSKHYVERILAQAPPGRVHTGRSGTVQSATRNDDRESERWTIRTADGDDKTYDAIVMACHADTALNILHQHLSAQDPLRENLGRFQFSKNKAVLHADERLMPVRRPAWSAWNFLAMSAGSDIDADAVSLTYWMNLLQSLPISSHGPVLVTLNPPSGPSAPRQSLVQGAWAYEHPVYTSDSVRAQAAIEAAQGREDIHFAGAWLKYGFHEDGFSSGIRAARRLGAVTPFEPVPAERPVPPAGVAQHSIAAFEAARRTFAPFLAPIVLLPLLLAAWVLETTLNLVSRVFRQPPRLFGAQRHFLSVSRAHWERALGGEVETRHSKSAPVSRWWTDSQSGAKVV